MTVTLPTSPVPSLPELGLSVAEELAALRVALGNINSLITNFNAGGVSETYFEAAAIVLGNDASSVTSGTLAGVFEAVNNVQLAAYILTAVGAALDNKAADVGVRRKPAVPANTAAAIAFRPNTPPGTVQVIPAGIVLAAQNADPTIGPVLYQTTSTATVNVGATISTFAGVTCLSAGTVGNCPPGSINQIVSGASGYTVANIVSISGGQNSESDTSLRERALNAIPAASQCTVFALQQDAISYPGINSAYVYDLTSPPPALIYPSAGDAQIFCDDGTGTLASTAGITGEFTIPNIGLSVAVPIDYPVAFNVNDNISINGESTPGGDPESITALVTAIAGSSYTLQITSQSSGNIGDTVASGAIITNPNSGALAQFNADLDAGKWKAAGAEVHAWGSTQVAIVLYMEVFLSADYLADIASEDEILSTIQTALFENVNSGAIGVPVVLSSLIDTAANVGGVAEVPVQTVLINGKNADFGVTNGIVSLIPAQTCRIASLSDVTVINRLTVQYG